MGGVPSQLRRWRRGRSVAGRTGPRWRAVALPCPTALPRPAQGEAGHRHFWLAGAAQTLGIADFGPLDLLLVCRCAVVRRGFPAPL